MKNTAVDQVIKTYDKNKGIKRALTWDDQQIKDLRELNKSIAGPERDLTSSELLKIVNIGLAKNTADNTQSAKVFLDLFESLGGKPIYLKLADKKILNKYSVFIISSLASSDIDSIKTLNEHFDSHVNSLNILINFLKKDELILKAIKLLSEQTVFTLEVVKKLSQLAEQSIQTLYSSLCILKDKNSEMITEDNVLALLSWINDNSNKEVYLLTALNNLQNKSNSLSLTTVLKNIQLTQVQKSDTTTNKISSDDTHSDTSEPDYEADFSDDSDTLSFGARIFLSIFGSSELPNSDSRDKANAKRSSFNS